MISETGGREGQKTEGKEGEERKKGMLCPSFTKS